MLLNFRVRLLTAHFTITVTLLLILLLCCYFSSHFFFFHVTLLYSYFTPRYVTLRFFTLRHFTLPLLYIIHYITCTLSYVVVGTCALGAQLLNKSPIQLFMQADVIDEQDHDGRVRSFAHVPGNWATHVFIKGTLYCMVFMQVYITELCWNMLPNRYFGNS